MMGEKLHLRLLGNVEITLDDAPVTGFVSVKAQALLCYLAVTGIPHTRPALAGLLWGERPEEAALLNLRKAISNLRRLVGKHLRITRQTVAFDRQSAYYLDVQEFEHLLSKDPIPLGDLQQALRLYRGDFLDGMYVRGAPDFEEWVLLKRAHLQNSAVKALRHLMTHYTRRGEYRLAIRYARRLLEMNPWQEDAHRQLMWLLAHSGQREAALAQYEQCRHILAADLGVEPMAETTALYERIRASRRILPSPLPPQPTPFVGRRGELRGIIRRLANPACRLLTLWGPGGIGKTRLALEAAKRLQDAFLHGVYFVPLATVTPPATLHLPYAIAESLHLSPHGAGRPDKRLFDFLREKEALLVLDNFEHLLDGGPFLAELLKAAPDVKLLVTSRERLRLRWEWLFEVRGLPVPGVDEPRPGRFDGVRLFIQEARRCRPGFTPGREMATVARICRLVEGLPLGIELAAALTGEYSCEEIAAGIERTLEFLRSPMQDIAGRHRSLQAAFDHSWGLLSADERRAFRRLAVFRGGFEAEAARQVAAVTPALLAALEAKSLLRRRPNGRYEMLEVLRQYAEERLEETGDEAKRIRAHHCAYYAAILGRLSAAIRSGADGHIAARDIAAEIDNIQAAWRWAVEQDDWRTLRDMLPALADFYKRRSWFREGEKVVGEAVAALRRAAARGENVDLEAQAESLSWLGLMVYKLGRHEEARHILEESLALAEEAKARRIQATALNSLAILTSMSGEYHRANALFQRSLAHFSAIGDRRMEAVVLNNIGLTHRIIGEHDRAYHFTAASLRICRERGLKTEEAQAVLALGIIAHSRKQYDEAIRRYQEGLTLFSEQGDRWGEAMAMGNLGAALTEKGEYDSARHVLSESLTLRREIGDRLGVVITLNNLGRVARELGACREATAHLDEALRIASEIPSVPMMLDALAEIALLLAEQGKTTRALELAYLVLRHPATDTITRQNIQEFIAQVERDASPEAIAQAQQWGVGQEVTEVTQEVREEITARSRPR